MLTQVARGGGGLHDEVFTLGRSKHARLFYGVGNIQEKIFLVFGGLRGTDVASTVVGVVSVVLTSSRELKCSVSDPSVKISKTWILSLGCTCERATGHARAARTGSQPAAWRVGAWACAWGDFCREAYLLFGRFLDSFGSETNISKKSPLL